MSTIGICPNCRRTAYNIDRRTCAMCGVSDARTKGQIRDDDRVWITVRDGRKTGVFLSETGAQLCCAANETIEVFIIKPYAEGQDGGPAS